MNRARVVVGFDFGLRRIGIAVGDTLTATAAPHDTLPHHADGPDWPAIERMLRLLGPDLLVVGAPYNDDGSPSRIAAQADAFAAQLAARFGLTVERADERFSSTAAHSLLREQRATGQRRRAVRKGDIDSAAAAVLLGSWLEQNRNAKGSSQ
ncbi:MAG TPA: Holliday junction resolvase RuvX [Steroidobacteraceae bacterium]|nr:Holliday junction resolvase RuvX [Steroidobacteraceae bacterium]